MHCYIFFGTIVSLCIEEERDEIALPVRAYLLSSPRFIFCSTQSLLEQIFIRKAYMPNYLKKKKKIVRRE